MSDVTRILRAIECGDGSASEELLPLVYAELRALAERRMAKEGPGQTLQATALVHEAYMRLVAADETAPLQWDSRGHFFAAAAEAMRRILIDRARTKRAVKRGGDVRRLELSCDLCVKDVPQELLDLDEALCRFAEVEPEKAELVKLRFFAGLTSHQAAEIMGISPATADRHWAFARAWLYSDLTRDEDCEGSD
jgi:RNA polymerase sigma factor (TIGR02999 family)